MYSSLLGQSSLIFYCGTKLGWGREEYTVCYTRKERSGLPWYRMGSWRLIGIRPGWKVGRCTLRREVENATHILLKYAKTK
jgi:hypothetical protein